MNDPLMFDEQAALRAHRRLSVALPCAFHSPLKMHELVRPSAPGETAEEKILAVVQSGEATVQDLVDETGMSEDGVRKAATRMAERGALVRTVRDKKAYFRVRLWLD